MPRHLTLETGKKSHPPILLIDTNSGVKNTLLDFLVKALEPQGQLYVLSSKQVEGNIEKISPLSIHLLDKLSDDLRYTVVFLDEESQKKKVMDIVDKLSERKTRIVLVVPYRVVERFIDVLLRLKEEKNVVIALIGDVFGKSNSSSPLSKVVQNALINKEVLVSGNELMAVYPISDTDVVSSLQYLLFGVKNPNPFYNIFYEHPQTLISMAHLLKRLEPELYIKYGKADGSPVQEKTYEQKKRYIKERTTVTPEFPLTSFIGFEKSVRLLQSGDSEVFTPPATGKRKKIFKDKNTYSAKFLKALRYGIFGLVLYIVVIFSVFLGSVFFFTQGVSHLSTGQLSSAERDLFLSRKLYDASRNTIFLMAVYPSQLTNGKLEEILVAYDDLSNIAVDMIPVVRKIQENNPSLQKKELQSTISSVIQLYFVLERYDIPELKKIISSTEFKKTSPLFTLLPVLESVLGYDTPKNYLLLFQNASELRPTGGFIGSVALLQIKNGKMSELNIQDVYDLDGQLKGHIEPPYIVRRYLQPHLYLRDSNFSPDFTEAASTAALLYNIESGKKIDGVIAVDTEVLKKILTITGPISLPGAGKVDSDNVVGLLSSSIQDNFFPGSTGKKDTLKTLLNKITVVLDTDKKKQLALIRALPALLAQKDILFSFANNSTQKAFIGAGYAGSLSDLRIAPHILPDFLSINEANIGVNKANQFITRSVTYSAFLKPTLLDSDALVEYTNTGDEDYKAYVRLITPKDSKLLTISVDGVEQKIVPAIVNPQVFEAKNFKPPQGLEVDQGVLGDHVAWGFIVNVPKNETSRIRVLYENVKIVPTETDFTYSLLYVKQPGTIEYPLVVQLQADDVYKTKGTGRQDPVLFDGKVSGDMTVDAKVTRIKQ